MCADKRRELWTHMPRKQLLQGVKSKERKPAVFFLFYFLNCWCFHSLSAQWASLQGAKPLCGSPVPESHLISDYLQLCMSEVPRMKVSNVVFFTASCKAVSVLHSPVSCHHGNTVCRKFPSYLFQWKKLIWECGKMYLHPPSHPSPPI